MRCYGRTQGEVTSLYSNSDKSFLAVGKGAQRALGGKARLDMSNPCVTKPLRKESQTIQIIGAMQQTADRL